MGLLVSQSSAMYVRGLGLASAQNNSNVTISSLADSPISQYQIKTGDSSFQVFGFAGIKKMVHPAVFIGHEVRIGYDTLSHDAFIRTLQSGETQSDVTVKGGLFYEISSKMGLERGDYALYGVMSLRSAQWSLQTKQGSLLSEILSNSGQEKRSSTAPGIGGGVDLVLNDRSGLRIEFLSYFPSNTSVFQDQSRAKMTGSLREHVLNIALIY